MDLVQEPKSTTFDKRNKELQDASGDASITVFGTSIYDESLYKVRLCHLVEIFSNLSSVPQAWSNIMHTLIPNAAVLSKHLTTLAVACSATEVVLFERTTFFVIATSSPVVTPSISSPQSPNSPGAEQDHLDIYQLNPTHYERTSELIKVFKHPCSCVREEFYSL